MPKVYHTKRAQQRYETKPVLDEHGQPKFTVMKNSKTGTPLLDRRGNERRMPVTERDLTKPLPMPQCDYCSLEIEVGTPYKQITPHGSYTRNRHEACPTWNVWEYSSSLSARVAEIQYNGSTAIDQADLEDLESVRDDIAQEIRSLAEEKEEAASNIEDGFGHSTYQSEEIQEQADNLNSWADEVEGVEAPEAEEQDCDNCNSTGEVDADCETCEGSGTLVSEDSEEADSCPDCTGTGTNDSEECPECGGTGTQDLDDNAIEEAKQALRDALDNCPL